MAHEQLPLPVIGDMVLGTPHRLSHNKGNSQPTSGDMVLGFMPSAYQKAIFDWLASGQGSCVVSAVPGSGKTTTLIKGANFIPKNLRSRFLAFNKHIADELNRKLPRHIEASTIHSLGLSSLCRAFRNMPEINKRKYSVIVKDYLADRKVHSSLEYHRLVSLVKFSQLTLADPSNSTTLKQLCHYYGLPSIGDWDFIQQAVFEILEIGIRQCREFISYEDMVWLPSVLNLPVYSYDFLCVDEVQDLNAAQIDIVMRAYKAGARGIFVGDERQAIMGFCAAARQSIANIIEGRSAIQLPLSICYRCPTTHIELANQIYNVIEPRQNAPSGTVTSIKIAEIPKLAKAGDLIICRCFYPLIPVYYELLKAGIAAKIKNKDIASQLNSLLDEIVGDSVKSYSCQEFTNTLQAWYESRKKQMLFDGVPMTVVVDLHDRILTLNAIYTGNNCQDTAELTGAIERLSKSDKNEVFLTTIHGSKGLEAERVFHIRPDLLPHPKAEKDWEKEQEKNLQFVAATRAKHDLFLAKK